MRRSIGDDLTAAGLGGLLTYFLGRWVLLPMFALIAVGVVLRLSTGREQTRARVRFDGPYVRPETVAALNAQGTPVTQLGVEYARVRVTNQSKRAAARVRAWSSVEGTPIQRVPLFWRHSHEPENARQANIDDNPPILLGPHESRDLDVAIRANDGTPYALSTLSYRALYLLHPDLRLEGDSSRFLVEVSGENVKPAKARFVLEHAAGGPFDLRAE